MADDGTVVDDQADGDGGVAAAIQQGIQAASQATATPMAGLRLGGAEALASQGVPAFSQQAQPIQTVPTFLSSTDPNAPIVSNIQPWNMADANLQPHMSRLHKVLDTVANIMGGGGQQTYHVTTDEQGNVSGISKTPATTGEKWGRIAAAALSGAAAGASQVGVGAGARSIAAGFQAGQQVAQAPLQRAREEAETQQNLMLRNAQMARIHQQIAEAQFNDKLAPIKEARLEAQEQLNFRNAVEDDGGTDYGTYSNEQEMRDMAQAHPELMNWHVGQGGQILKIPQSDGKTHVYGLPADAGGTRLTEPRAYPKLVTADAKGNITTSDETETAPRGTKTTEYWNHVQARIAQNLQAENTASQIRQREATPGGKQQPIYLAPTGNKPAAILYPGGPNEQAVIKPIQGGYTARLGTERQGAEGGTPTPEQIGHWSDLLADPNTGLTMAQIPRPARQAVIDDMAARGMRMTHPLTAQELQRSDLANNAIDNIEEAQRILEAHPDMFGPVGYGKTKFRRLIEGGDPNALAYQTAVNLANLPAVGIHGVRGKYALMDIANLDADLYTNADAMRQVLSEIHRSASDFAKGGGRRTPTQSAPPPPSAAAPAAGGATRPHTMADVPQGAHAGKDPQGNIVGYQDATGWHPF